MEKISTNHSEDNSLDNSLDNSSVEFSEPLNDSRSTLKAEADLQQLIDGRNTKSNNILTSSNGDSENDSSEDSSENSSNENESFGSELETETETETETDTSASEASETSETSENEEEGENQEGNEEEELVEHEGDESEEEKNEDEEDENQTIFPLDFNMDDLDNDLIIDTICQMTAGFEQKDQMKNTIAKFKALRRYHHPPLRNFNEVMKILTLKDNTRFLTQTHESLIRYLVKNTSNTAFALELMFDTRYPKLAQTVVDCCVKFQLKFKTVDLLRKVRSQFGKKAQVIKFILQNGLLKTSNNEQKRNRDINSFGSDSRNKTNLTKILNLLISAPYPDALSTYLSNPELPVDGLCRFGVFQCIIERNFVKVVEMLVNDKRILAFYFDIITNILERKSPIIRSKKMNDILISAVQKSTTSQ